jgi:hypothetical protein
MKTVTLALNPLEPETWTTHEVNDVREFLVEQFAEWPSTARIYNEFVSSATDVTPACEADVKRLGELEGPFYVVVYPADPVTIIVAIVAVVVVAAVVMAAQQPPTPTLRNTQNQSPNNELSERSNKPRPMARIPDIFGTVRSTPDLIAVPYTTYVNNQEVENMVMCIGRGQYEIHDAYDDTTLCSDIAGTTIQVYKPNTSINSGTPYYQIGTPLTDSAYNAARSNSVNGQVLRAPNSNSFKGNSNIYFKYPDIIRTGYLEADDYDLTEAFSAGDVITVSNAAQYQNNASVTKSIIPHDTSSFKYAIPSSTLPTDFQAGFLIELRNAVFNSTDADGFLTQAYDLSGNYTVASVNLITEVVSGEFGTTTTYYCRVVLTSPSSINANWNKVASYPTGATSVNIIISSGAVLYDLAGVYTVLGVSRYQLSLANPASVNPDWNELNALPGDESPAMSSLITTSGDKWVGPFILEASTRTRVWANFVALNGLYKDNGSDQNAVRIYVEIEVTPIDENNNPTGAAQTFQTSLLGSAYNKESRGVTLKAATAVAGRCRVRARRVTPSDLAFEGQVVDEVKWRDLYAISPMTNANFGNVTVVRGQSYATAGALALKERKLNMLVTRKIPTRVSGSTFTTELYATNDAAEIISAICLDTHIGNRQIAEIDFDAIYNAIGEVKTYFGNNKAAEFCYTFDSDNLSFEETVKAVADAVFCTAYRRGNIIKLSFEQETQDSTLLFNHRNKLPGSETRTVRFGNQDNFDGVSFEYIDPEDDAQVTYYIPEDRSAVNPKEFESLGIRNRLQAYFHAWRMWNKIRYQNVITEFTATQEADLLVRNDRILVADNTRPDTQDGEVLSQNVLQLTLSQNVDMTKYAEYTIFLQLSDGTIESIAVTPGATARQVVLAYAPRLPLALDDDLYARTTFMLVGNSEPRENAFLVSEKTSQSNFTSVVRAVNYDSRYYGNDKDLINGVVNENGDYV